MRPSTLTFLAWLAAMEVAPSPLVAQPAEPVTISPAERETPRPEVARQGARLMAVHAFFQGFPSDIRDARDLLDGRSIAPAFNVWCGLTPYVDFTNSMVRDSAGRQAPEVLCLPFLDPARMNPPYTCADLDRAPRGTYYQQGGYVLRVAGLLEIRSPGVYTLAWGHDDGMAFHLGSSELFVYADPTGSRVDRRAIRIVEAGHYPFVLDWFDTGGGALIDWYIAEGDATEGAFSLERFRLVARDDLSPTGTLGCTARCTSCTADAPICDLVRGRCVRCLSDSDCDRCARCHDERCVPLRELPGADGGAACTPDVVSAPVDGASVGTLDASSSAPLMPRGCECGVTPREGSTSSTWILAMVVVQWMRARRR